MNKFKFYFILLITTATIFSCSKDDDNFTPEPLRDYTEQYNADIAIIEEYLNTNYIDLTDPNYADKDAVIKKITDPATQPSLMSYTINATEGSTVFPQLRSKEVAMNGITYKLYYLVIREGEGLESTSSPCNMDAVYTAYKGNYLYRTVGTTEVPATVNPIVFEDVTSPEKFFSLFETITGWGEVFPEFKSGTRTTNTTDGTITYSGFGNGIMFLPSGLAYYNNPQVSIPAYSPLVFSFRLYDIQRLDQDEDGIPSYLEDLNGDGYMRVLPTSDPNRFVDDTDHDLIPNFADTDDDGDTYTTKIEINNPSTSLPYAFDLIPSCNGDTSDPKRIKKYLDITCH